MKQEAFLQDVDWVDALKLRASYGEVGNNMGVSLYGHMALYTIDKNGGEAALVKQSLSAPDIKWETTQTVDVAVEGASVQPSELPNRLFRQTFQRPAV